MPRILKLAGAAVAAALVVVGAVVVYRETDLLTGSLVLLSGLMIAALFARRAAAREERAGMAEWESETRDSEQAAEDLFSDWAATSPRDDRTLPGPSTPVIPSAPSVAPPVAPNGSAHSPVPDGAEVPQPADPSVAVSRPLRRDDPQDTESLVASLFLGDDTATAAAAEPEPMAAFEPAAPVEPMVDVDDYISAPAFSEPEPAYAGATSLRSPIDWTGQGGRVDERVTNSEDIMRASEATALPTAGEGGSELARLLAKVEARLRDYD